jgi:dTDP-4-amino-4,6-dideoxygalactose transaminase
MDVIRFSKPFKANNTLKYIEDAFQQGLITGDGVYTSHFINTTFGSPCALLTTSCSTALDMSAILIDLRENDEVILPSFTFVSTANSILLRNAKPVFADIDEDTLNINPVEINDRITKRTRAIFPVHYAGVSCDMNSIMSIARDYKLIVVEDAAQGVNAKYQGKYLGTIGDIGCYSFHDTKNYTCGEGGAILINKSRELAERAEIIREKGTNRNQFFRGEVDKYTWVDIGSSLLPSDVLAAILYAQFEHLDEIQLLRKQIYTRYYEGLKDLENRELLRLPVIPEDCDSNYHLFHIVLPSEKIRDHTLSELKKLGIMAAFHYVPLHISPMGQKLGYKKGDFPVTESLSCRLLRLPLYPSLSLSEQDYIIDNLYKIL